MSILDRLRGREEAPQPVRVAVVGAGPEAGRLAASYESEPGVDLVGCELQEYGDGVIRSPVVKTPGLDALDEVIRAPGLQAIEVVAPLDLLAAAATTCLKAGLFTSINPPADPRTLAELNDLAKAYDTRLRLRLLPFYYPPYREFKRLIDEDAVGLPMGLRMMTRRGKGTDLPEKLDPHQWIVEHELGFLALATWLLGPIEKVHARLETATQNGGQPSSVLMWKYQQRRLYGFLQLDFCPGLHVRTFTEPVHRALELTAANGLIMATRGEGQMLRTPALVVRGKSTTTAFEMIPDDWREVYNGLADEMIAIVKTGKRPAGSASVLEPAFDLMDAARRSSEQGDEASL